MHLQAFFIFGLLVESLTLFLTLHYHLLV